MNRPILLVAAVTFCCSGCLCVPAPQCLQPYGAYPAPYHAAPLYPGDVRHGTGPCGCGDPCGTIGCGDCCGGPVMGGFDCGCHQPVMPEYGCAQPIAAGCQQPVAYPAMPVPTYSDSCGETGLMQPVPDNANQRYEPPRSTVMPQVREFEGAPAPVPPATDDAGVIEQSSLVVPAGGSVPWLSVSPTPVTPTAASTIHGVR